MYNINPLYEITMPNYAAWKNKPMRDPAKEFRHAQMKERATGKPMNALDFQQETLMEGPLGDTIDKKIDRNMEPSITSAVIKQALRDSSSNVLRDIRRGQLKGRFTKKDKERSPIKTALRKFGVKALNKLPTSIRCKVARKTRDKAIKAIKDL